MRSRCSTRTCLTVCLTHREQVSCPRCRNEWTLDETWGVWSDFNLWEIGFLIGWILDLCTSSIPNSPVRLCRSIHTQVSVINLFRCHCFVFQFNFHHSRSLFLISWSSSLNSSKCGWTSVLCWTSETFSSYAIKLLFPLVPQLWTVGPFWW